MRAVAPITKLALTVFVTLWAILLHSLPALTLLIVTELILCVISKVGKTVYKGIASLFIFACFLAILQYAFNQDSLLAAVTAAKMIAMTLVFFLLLSTTKMQDLSAALVLKCHVPYEYAFMLTTALRFIPDFLAEIKAIQEAQACRGYQISRNIFKRLFSYMAIIKPLVLRAVTKSETMALSLELRGFGNKHARSFSNDFTLKFCDYALFLTMLVITSYLVVQIY